MKWFCREEATETRWSRQMRFPVSAVLHPEQTNIISIFTRFQFLLASWFIPFRVPRQNVVSLCLGAGDGTAPTEISVWRPRRDAASIAIVNTTVCGSLPELWLLAALLNGCRFIGRLWVNNPFHLVQSTENSVKTKCKRQTWIDLQPKYILVLWRHTWHVPAKKNIRLSCFHIHTDFIFNKAST